MSAKKSACIFSKIFGCHVWHFCLLAFLFNKQHNNAELGWQAGNPVCPPTARWMPQNPWIHSYLEGILFLQSVYFGCYLFLFLDFCCFSLFQLNNSRTRRQDIFWQAFSVFYCEYLFFLRRRRRRRRRCCC